MLLILKIKMPARYVSQGDAGGQKLKLHIKMQKF
jgi:hypothetical protein